MEKLLQGHLSFPNVILPSELHSFLTHSSLLSFISVRSNVIQVVSTMRFTFHPAEPRAFNQILSQVGFPVSATLSCATDLI